MKWFVTDAQLAQIRWDAQQDVLANYTNRYEAEITRLREDRAAELARVADPNGPFVEHLKAEVAYWRLQFQHERQRAEVAIDQCRATHQGIGPVSLPLRDDRPPSAFPQSEEQALASLNLDGM